MTRGADPMKPALVHDVGLELHALGGPWAQRLRAAQQAGFVQVTLRLDDVIPQGGAEVCAAQLRSHGLRGNALLAPLDFEGAPPSAQRYRLDNAKDTLTLCRALGSSTLIVPASPYAAQVEPEAVRRDLRRLALLAVPLRLRIAYAASPSCADELQVWERVCDAEMPNLGLALNLANWLRVGQPVEDLEMLDPDWLYWVGVADLLPADGAEAASVWPGYGAHTPTLAAALSALHALGYRGHYSLGSDDPCTRLLAPATCAQRAMQAAQWLGNDVLKRSVPLPRHLRLRRPA